MALDWFKDFALSPIALDCPLALASLPIALEYDPEASASQPIAVEPWLFPMVFMTLALSPNAMLVSPPASALSPIPILCSPSAFASRPKAEDADPLALEFDPTATEWSDFKDSAPNPIAIECPFSAFE